MQGVHTSGYARMKPTILNVVRIVRIYWEKWPKSDQCQDIVRFVSNMSGQSQDIWVNLSYIFNMYIYR